MFTFNRIKRLQKKSLGAVNIFTKTVDNLASINGNIESEKKTREEKIAVIANEKQTLEIQQKQNEEIISKINKIFQ